MAWTDSTVAVRKRKLDETDIAFARAKSSAGFQPSAIARMMGVCIDDVNALVPRAPMRGAPRLTSSRWAEPEPQPPAEPVPVIEREPFTQMERVVAQVAAEYGVSLERLRGRGATKALSIPRQHAMWALDQVRRENGQSRFSRFQIGRFLGDRDPTTILHGVAKHEARLSSTPTLDEGLFALSGGPKTEENQSGEEVLEHQPHPSKPQVMEA